MIKDFVRAAYPLTLSPKNHHNSRLLFHISDSFVNLSFESYTAASPKCEKNLNVFFVFFLKAFKKSGGI